MEADLAGADRRVVASGHNVEHPVGVAVTGSHLCWLNVGNDQGGSLVQSDLDGTHQDPLFEHVGDQLYALAAGDNSLYYTFLDPEGGAINRFSLTDEREETIVPSPHTVISGVAVDGGHLYWANKTDDTIMKADLDGTHPHTVASGDNVVAPVGVAVDGDHLYWTNVPDTGNGSGRIVRANLNGSDQRQIVTDVTDPAGVAVGPQANRGRRQG